MEGERKIKRAKEREKRGETGGEDEGTRPLPQSPLVFPALSLALFFARAPLSERLEQAIYFSKFVNELNYNIFN